MFINLFKILQVTLDTTVDRGRKEVSRCRFERFFRIHLKGIRFEVNSEHLLGYGIDNSLVLSGQINPRVPTISILINTAAISNRNVNHVVLSLQLIIIQLS